MYSSKKSDTKIFIRNILIAVTSSFAAVIVILILTKGFEITKEIGKFPLVEILTNFIIFSLIFLIDAIRTKVLGYFLGEKFSLGRAVENSALGYFFSYITPFSAGGQPFQIYHLTKNGMKTENATAIIITRWSNMLIFLSFSSLFLMGRFLKFIQTGIHALNQIASIIIIGSVVVSLIIVSSLLFPEVASLIIKILGNSIFKNIYSRFSHQKLDKELNKLSAYLEKFYESIRTIWIKKPLLVVADMGLGILDFIIIFYILYRSIMISFSASHSYFNLSFFEISAVFILLSFIVYYVPTPGASGGVEGGFFAVLSHYGNSTAVMRGILVWRLSTYYAVILLGIVIIFIRRRSLGYPNE